MPLVSETNVPPSAEWNVPLVSDWNVPSVSEWNVPLKKSDVRSFSEVINDYLCGRSKTLKQGDYGKQESDNDRFETINSRIYQGHFQT